MPLYSPTPKGETAPSPVTATRRGSSPVIDCPSYRQQIGVCRSIGQQRKELQRFRYLSLCQISQSSRGICPKRLALIKISGTRLFRATRNQRARLHHTPSSHQDTMVRTLRTAGTALRQSGKRINRETIAKTDTDFPSCRSVRSASMQLLSPPYSETACGNSSSNPDRVRTDPRSD